MRPIDADALKAKFENQDSGALGGHKRYFVCCVIEDEPTIDVEPIKHGHWIRGKNKSAFPAKPSPIWYCSCCGEMIRYNDSTGTYQKKKRKVNEVNPRCRRCGARMDGDSE